ncbi:hypothetical protein BT93_D1667 [Corymbia citriodora subsp. variegata]|nr:hypothetical protein BT93_D1667 [Corymbia citriodora subsp. variegata]
MAAAVRNKQDLFSLPGVDYIIAPLKVLQSVKESTTAPDEKYPFHQSLLLPTISLKKRPCVYTLVHTHACRLLFLAKCMQLKLHIVRSLLKNLIKVTQVRLLTFFFS